MALAACDIAFPVCSVHNVYSHFVLHSVPGMYSDRLLLGIQDFFLRVLLFFLRRKKE